ncbi:MAG: DUF4114 domain-containing protein [Chitinivibrionales bacterium]|nr:DUF4114 domain-containing protein [Chitinivibrionales bacterium]
MKIFKTSAILGLLLAGSLFADIIVTTLPGFDYDNSWDGNPPGNLIEIVDNLNVYLPDDADIYLDQVDTEIFTGKGAFSIVLGEFAGMAPNTTFGWYEQGSSDDLNQIFDGSDSFLDQKTIKFDEVKDFGFYIDPNGDKLYNGTDYTPHYTEAALNPTQVPQVAVFEVRGADDTYILGWEDLPITGNPEDSDADYQDMIVGVKIHSVPEPSTYSLIGIGLFCLSGFWFARKKKRS